MLRLTDCIRTTVCLVFASAYASAAAEAPKATPKIEGNTIEGVRNARYCEIIPIVRDGLHLTATVYNTLGLNDCPAQIWHSITEDTMKQRFGAVTVLLNGPRYFLMDSITASGSTKAGEKIEAVGFELTERATIDVGLLDLCTGPIASRPSIATRCITSRPDCPYICWKRRTAAATRCKLIHKSWIRHSHTTSWMLSAAN
jgi:hypothetical protein